MKPTRAAVIGCGGIARSGHLPAYQAAARRGLCELVGVCDSNPGRARSAGDAFQAPFFGSVDELLREARPEVVSIATLPPAHRDLTVRALAAGCHVLCEKPIALNLGEAVEMVGAAERAGRLLSICFEYRYWDEAVYLRQRIANGDFGHVHAIRTWGGGPRELSTDPVRRSRAATGGGVLTHWTIHNLDLALWLLGNPEPLTASAFGYQRLARLPPAAFTSWLKGVTPGDPDVEDFAVGFIRLAGGTSLTVEANFLSPPSARPEGWELLGDRAAASISPIRFWRDAGDAWLDETPPPGTLAPCDYDMGRLIEGFLTQVRSGGPAPVSGPEILRIQRLIDALYESMATGREVALA
jgi:predicted dehydrogenase